MPNSLLLSTLSVHDAISGHLFVRLLPNYDTAARQSLAQRISDLFYILRNNSRWSWSSKPETHVLLLASPSLPLKPNLKRPTQIFISDFGFKSNSSSIIPELNSQASTVPRHSRFSTRSPTSCTSPPLLPKSEKSSQEMEASNVLSESSATLSLTHPPSKMSVGFTAFCHPFR